jgi:membrane protease YdiL (CAAX protease family)
VLSEKPWKADGVVRLLLSLFVCIYAWSLGVSCIQFLHMTAKPDSRPIIVAVLSLGFLIATIVLARRPWSLENFMGRILVLLSCLYAGLLLGMWAQKLTGSTASSGPQPNFGMLTLECAALVLIGFFLRDYKLSWNEAFGFPNQWRHAMLLGVLIALIFLPVGWGLQQGSALIMDRFRLHPEEQQAVHALRTTVSWVDRLSLAAVAILLAPTAEEVLFRGILYPSIRQAGFPRLALWSTSVVFAAMHVNLMTFVPLTVLALVLTVLYEKTNNLLSTITAHSVFNALNFGLFYFMEHASRAK